MNNDFELDRKTDLIGDKTQSKAKVSPDGGFFSSDNVVDGDRDKGSSSYGGSDEDKSVNLVGPEEITVSEELENRAPESDVDGSVLVGDVNIVENSGSEKTRVPEGDWKGVVKEKKSWASDIRNEEVTQDVNDHKMGAKKSGSEQWGSRVEEDGFNSKENVELTPLASEDKIDVWSDGVEHSGSRVRKGHVDVGKSSVYQYDSMISMFDEFASNGKGKALRAAMSTSVGYGYEIGDMVWGKVKSHPWWPGHIYNEAFASPSVRRTKRAGHLLVAFFGDSSYGWFDPDELIPFDTTFSEKSRQTNSRNFVKAVEEAVDEASRRCGLGLACRCRNPYNFRPTNVQGYLAVDVGDCEPGGVYSVNQIRKARDSFQPREILAFMKQLALTPRTDGHGSIDFIKNKSTVFAYRKAVFEEFDETYAQAFGAQPVRPSRIPTEAVTQAVRAPLSGPLVIAEALGKRKNSAKPNRAKDQGHRDKYLFKRRDEPSELKIEQTGPTNSSTQPAYVEGSMALAAGDYVLQKRAPVVSAKQQIPAEPEWTMTIGMDGGSVSSGDATGGEVVTTENKPAVARFSLAGSAANGSKVEPPASFADSFPVRQASAYTGHLSEPKSFVDKGKGYLLEGKERTAYNVIADPKIMGGSGLSGKGAFHGGIDGVRHGSEQKGEVTINLRHDRQSETTSKLDEGFSLPAIVEEVHRQEQVCGDGSGHVLPTTDAKLYGQDSRMHIDTGTKKGKPLKRPVGELGPEKSVSGEKKKKRKKELGLEMCSDRMQRQPDTGKGGASLGRVAGKSVQVGLPDSLGTQPMVGMGNVELKLPQLLGDLQSLALNPFHGVERNSPAVIRQAFLQFRSVVYQKSLALSTPAEMESNEVHAPKSPAAGIVVTDNPPRENSKGLPSLKPPKPLARPDDPTKGGRKRGPSDRQEEMAAKRLKKINDMKSLAVEKASQKTPEAQRDGKETVAVRPLKPLKPDLVKKTVSPAKAPEPTMLVMKFPPKTTLPSGSELKARLARFGPLDHSSTRIFWKSSTCRVVFIHRVDAEAAHRHLTGNNSLFGNVNVRCHIRPLGATATESESKLQREDGLIEALQLRDSAVEQRPPAAVPAQQPMVQLKSCLKKPMGDEAGTATGGNGGGSRGTPRVKFLLVGGESSGGEQLLAGNKNNNASFADGGASSSHGMDFNSKNFQKVIPPPPLPILPLPLPPAQFPSAPTNLRYAEAATRNSHNFNTNLAAAVTSETNIDITQQMLSLLTKCNDVVTNVRSFLGYVPYHPL